MDRLCSSGEARRDFARPACAPPRPLVAGTSSGRARLPRPRAEGLEGRVLLSVFTVTTTADDGAGSLRQAILSANTAPGADEVRFNIPGEAGR